MPAFSGDLVRFSQVDHAGCGSGHFARRRGRGAPGQWSCPIPRHANSRDREVLHRGICPRSRQNRHIASISGSRKFRKRCGMQIIEMIRKVPSFPSIPTTNIGSLNCLLWSRRLWCRKIWLERINPSLSRQVGCYANPGEQSLRGVTSGWEESPLLRPQRILPLAKGLLSRGDF